MKRLNLVFLVLGVSIIFFGCSKDDSLAPELGQSDQVTNSLKSAKIPFTEFSGTSTPVAVPDYGTPTVLPNGKTKITGMIAEWYDAASDPLVTGTSIWYEDWMIEADGSSAHVGGKADIILNDDGGTWKVSWHGMLTAYEGYTLYDPTHPFTAVAYAVGTGKTGDVKGMVAHWTYIMDFDGTPETFAWAFTGSYH